MGGFLSSNAKEETLTQFTYLKPNLFISAIYLVAAVGVLIGLNETLESMKRSQRTRCERAWGTIRSWLINTSPIHTYMAVDSENPITPLSGPQEGESTIPQSPKRKRKLPFGRMWTWNVICTMLSHLIISGHLGTFTNLWAIFLSTPVGNPREHNSLIHFSGGLGMLPRDVGLAMALLGGIGVISQLIFYPMLQDRFGTVRIWRTALLIFPLVYLLAPFPSFVVSAPSLSPPRARTLTWLTVVPVIFLFISSRTGVTPATTLLINDCTPHPSVRATIHTVGTVTGNLSRSIFPVAVLTIFGHGLQIGIVGLGFWCLSGLALLAYGASLWVTEGSNGKEIILSDDSDEE